MRMQGIDDPLEVLPPEMLYMIFGHLPSPVIRNLKRVSSRWNLVIDENLVILNTLKDLYPYLNLEKIEKLSNAQRHTLLEKQVEIYRQLAKQCTMCSAKEQLIFQKALAVAEGDEDDIEDKYKGKAFKLMARIGNLEKLKKWNEQFAAVISNKEKEDALWEAALSGNLECLQYLISSFGKDIRDPWNKMSFIWTAVQNNHFECAKCLIEAYAKDISTNNKEKILYEIAIKGNLACMQALMDVGVYGEEISAEAKGMACYQSAKNGRLECLQYLMNVWDEKDISDSDKREALCFTIGRGHLECLKYLIEKFGKTFFIDQKSFVDQAAQTAAQCGCHHITQYLEKYQSEDGSPIVYAYSNEMKQEKANANNNENKASEENETDKKALYQIY